MGCVSEKAGTDGAECSRKVVSGRKEAGAIRSLVNARDLQLECARVFHQTLQWREKERSRIRAVQMDNLRGLLGFRRIDKVPNARIKELCGVTKGVDERIDEGVLQWFGHVERMEKERIAKRVYARECACSHSVGRPRKRWIDTVTDCLRKRGLDVRHARRMVQDKSEWRGFVRRSAWA